MVVFAAQKPVAAITVCRNAVKYLDDRGIQHGKAAVDALTNSPAWRSLDNKTMLVGIALPVVSRDGNDALVEISNSIGITAGAGGVWHLRRQSDGKWVTVGTARGWIA